MNSHQAAGHGGVAIDRGAAIHYIRGRRCPQGGYSFYRTPEWGVEEPSAPDTFAALDALRLLGEPAQDAEQSVAWLQSLQNGNGSWPTLTIASAADAALALLNGTPRHDPSSWLRGQWAHRVKRKSNRAWEGALVGLHQLLQLVQHYLPQLLVDEGNALSVILAQARDPSGVWSIDGPDLESTSTALALANMAHWPLPNVSSVSDWWHLCEDPILGLRMTPTAGQTTAATLRSGLDIALSLDLHPRHPRAIATQLYLMQHPSGGFGARHRALATLQDTRQALCAVESLSRLTGDLS
ncbi:prenyltransferase/squalene oxidase repeat-containing protein [Acidithiobacillus sp. M4-SHS-6]|uniref:prenyltransferase/squalene oxidase repeat-containing protein n=1 Tax=Acidithiobacillus sp. M4-SHS-6 TaxID=3383024 RepID=UPI0039BDE6EA